VLLAVRSKQPYKGHFWKFAEDFRKNPPPLPKTSASLQALASIIPGLATGAALAPGATIPAQAIIIPGDVTLSGATAIPRDPLTAATARLASIPAAPRGAFTPV
jgi:hypothetical protein